jgi:hypothetical protein
MEPKLKQTDVQKRFSYVTVPKESKTADFKKLYTKGIDIHIGCISFNVFDHLGNLKNSNKRFSVWPFYAHDPQLG